MKLMHPFYCTLFITLALYCPTVTQWYHATKNMPPDKRVIKPLIPGHLFLSYLESYITMQKKFFKDTAWLHEKSDLSDEKINNAYVVHPVILKYSVDSDARIFFWGDLHGDIQALSNSLYKLYQDHVIDNNFNILSSRDHFFFLGDLVDRGEHGSDTLSLLFTFALKNPGRVIILRGNHEDISINRNYEQLGFEGQLKKLYSDSPEMLDQAILRIINFYNLLPVAAFLGCNDTYFQCCHGGLEPRYNPHKLLKHPFMLCLENITDLYMPKELLDTKNLLFSCALLNINKQCLNYTRWYTKLYAGNIYPTNLGFLWNDFRATNSTSANAAKQTTFTPGRGLMLGQTFSQAIFDFYSRNNVYVKGIIRGHQHNESMPGLFMNENNGVYSLWNNSVLTTIATGHYGRLPAFIELIVHNDFNEWHLRSNTMLPTGIWQTKQSRLNEWKNGKE